MYTPVNSISRTEYTATIEDISIKLGIEHSASSDRNTLPTLIKHIHAYNELFVCISGRLNLMIEDACFELGSGDAVLVPTNLSHHKLFEDLGTVWCSIGFLITTNRHRSVSKLSQRIRFWSGSETLTLKKVPEFCSGIYELYTRTSSSNDCVPAIEFLLLLVKYTESLQNSPLPTSAISTDSNMNRIATLDHLVNAQFMTDITPGVAANLLHISTRQLSRISKKHFGTTFTRAIINKRLETAAKLLSDTEQTVESIVESVGFTSPSFMYSEFKTRYNMTPMEYRNSYRI